MSENDAATADVLESRYGRTRRRRFDRWLLAGLGAAVILVASVWAIWAASSGTASTLDVRDTGHRIVDERSVEVRFELSITEDTPVYCVVEALNEQFAVVGWKVVKIPGADRYTRSLTESVRTTQEATTGLINRCWLA